jgi:hypothetical protein
MGEVHDYRRMAGIQQEHARVVYHTCCGVVRVWDRRGGVESGWRICGIAQSTQTASRHPGAAHPWCPQGRLRNG